VNEFGYYFHPSKYKGLPGHPQLDINIYTQPTEQHFDPERVTLPVADSGGLSTVTITHPWSGHKQMQLCTGRIIIHDRRDKVVEGFTLGGEITITNLETATSCKITSPAPIIHLFEDEDIATLLVSEFEAMLAKQRASWVGKTSEFEQHLCQADPHTLFVAGLMAIKDSLTHTLAVLHNERYYQTTHIINEAIHIVREKDKWPEQTPALSDLL